MMRPLTRLDVHVRRALLSYPLIFPTRAAVLRHLFLVSGNGYEWEGDEPVNVMTDSEVWSEEECRRTFFEDIERLEVEFESSPEIRLERARRQLQLDHIDDLALESPYGSGGRMDLMSLMTVSSEYGMAFTIPEGAEESFARGAIEALRQVIVSTTWTRDPAMLRLREAAQAQIDVLRKRLGDDVRDAAMAATVAEMIKDMT